MADTGSRSHALGDLVRIERGSTYKSAQLGSEGLVLLGLATIAQNGGFRSDSLRRYSGPSPERMIVEAGELYASLKDVTQSGDLLGAVARFPDHLGQGRLTQDTVKLVPKGDQALLKHVYWVLRTPQYRDYCRAHATGTTTLGLAREDFLGFRVPESNRARRVLVDLLEAIEEKVELNRRMNDTLEQLAQGLFEDAVSRHDGVDLTRIRCLVTEHTAKVNPQAAPDEVFDHYSLPAFDSGAGPVTEAGRAIKSAKTVVPDKAVLVSRLNPRIPRVWLPDVGDARRAIASTEFLVLTPAPTFSRSLLYMATSSRQYQNALVSMATGTSGSHQRVRPSAALNVVVNVPSVENRAAIEGQTGPMLERIQKANRETAALTHLRDTLLPRLISGDLRLPDAERLVSEVT